MWQVLDQGRQGTRFALAQDRDGTPAMPSPKTQHCPYAWDPLAGQRLAVIVGQSQEVGAGRAWDVVDEGSGCQDHALRRWQKTEGYVNGGSKPPAQASLSHCFSLTKCKLKDKIIKNVKTMHSEH